METPRNQIFCYYFQHIACPRSEIPHWCTLLLLSGSMFTGVRSVNDYRVLIEKEMTHAVSSSIGRLFCGTPGSLRADLGSRAATQARYRARNQDSERAKARQWMQALRHDKKQNEADAHRRRLSSEHLRSSVLFQRYKAHVRHYFGTLSGPESDPHFVAGWDRFRFTTGAFDREDALFVLRYSMPAVSAPTSEELDRQVPR
ncbi:hypothetical protein K438DRAFT_190448 [Mycena galopus ATCC 62051]|nr:hypothetical protein K438DRAFT_190448 [Mycena galopus ATCC 62051]